MPFAVAYRDRNGNEMVLSYRFATRLEANNRVHDFIEAQLTLWAKHTYHRSGNSVAWANDPSNDYMEAWRIWVP